MQLLIILFQSFISLATSCHLVISITECSSSVTKSWLTLCNPMDCSPCSSVHGILQARRVEWVAIFFCRGSSRPRNQTQVSCISGRYFTDWATREASITERNVLKSPWFYPPLFLAACVEFGHYNAHEPKASCCGYFYCKSICMFVPFSLLLQVFLLIQSEKMKNDYIYLSWLARCCESSFKRHRGIFLFLSVF